MTKKTFSLVFALFFLISAFFITNCSNQDTPLLELEEDFMEQEVITPLDIPVTIKDGALVFKDYLDFRKTLRVLDTIDLISRKAWEESIGFTSIRTIYEEVLDKYFNGEPINHSDYQKFIDFSGNQPILKDNDDFTASILNHKNIVYLAENIGTVRLDGWYWIRNGTKEQLDKLLISKRSDLENGILVYLYDGLQNENDIGLRYCTLQGISPEYTWIENGVLSNGSGAGSSKLFGNFTFKTTASLGPNNTSYYEVFVRMTGHSQRYRSNKWRDWRADHTFSWDFQVRQGSNPGVFTNYSGQETHYNNINAAKYIDIFSQVVGNEWLVSNVIILTEVYSSPQNGNGTFQTTNYLTPQKIEYDCN